MTRYRDAIFKADNRCHATAAEEPKQPKQSKQPEKPTEPVKATIESSSIIPASSEKALRLHFRRALLIYSRVQYKLKLTFTTLFRAIAIYKAAQQLNLRRKEPISEDDLLVVCLFLSMKYEEIYPPRLSKLLHILGMSSLSQREYCCIEKEVLIMLGGNLNLPSLKVKMDGYLDGQSDAAYLYAYYLLELSLQEDRLCGYSWDELCLSILFLMTSYGDILKKKKRIDEGVSEERVEECAKLIIKARYEASERSSKYFTKYCNEVYKRVAERPAFLQLE